MVRDTECSREASLKHNGLCKSISPKWKSRYANPATQALTAHTNPLSSKQRESTSRSETTRQNTVPKKCEIHVGRFKNMYPMSSNGVRILRAGVTVVKLELTTNNSTYARIPRSGTLQKLSSVRSSEAESQLDASVVPRTWPYKLLRMQTCRNEWQSRHGKASCRSRRQTNARGHHQ